MSDIIELTETARLRLEPEVSPECPRGDWHMLTGFVNIEGRGDGRLMDVPAVYEPPIPILEAHDRLVGWRGGSRDESVVERWARAFHGLYIEYDYEHGGYWFVAGADAVTATTPVNSYSRALFFDNWPHLIPGTPEHLEKQAEVIQQEQETYRQWADGEVYIVILERQHTYEKRRVTRLDFGFEVDLTVEPEVYDKWEEVDSLGGNYLDDEYTAEAVADEHFDLTDEEQEALNLLLPSRQESTREPASVSGEW